MGKLILVVLIVIKWWKISRVDCYFFVDKVVWKWDFDSVLNGK